MLWLSGARLKKSPLWEIEGAVVAKAGETEQSDHAGASDRLSGAGVVRDAFGHPVYLETYAGKAPVGARILGLLEKIEGALEGPGPALRVTRVIVMDAASNGVATLRAFAEQDRYHYITALDDNQWNPSKVRERGRAKRYYYGEATLRDCQIELEDSREKGGADRPGSRQDHGVDHHLPQRESGSR